MASGSGLAGAVYKDTTLWRLSFEYLNKPIALRFNDAYMSSAPKEQSLPRLARPKGHNQQD